MISEIAHAWRPPPRPPNRISQPEKSSPGDPSERPTSYLVNLVSDPKKGNDVMVESTFISPNPLRRPLLRASDNKDYVREGFALITVSAS